MSYVLNGFLEDGPSFELIGMKKFNQWETFKAFENISPKETMKLIFFDNFYELFNCFHLRTWIILGPVACPAHPVDFPGLGGLHIGRFGKFAFDFSAGIHEIGTDFE